MPAWPATMPQFGINMDETRQDGTIRTAMDTGPAKSRRRFSATNRFYSASFTITSAQRATFDTFYEDTIAEGASEFTVADVKDGVTRNARLVEPPTITHLWGNGGTSTAVYRLTCKMEILP